MIAQFTPQLAEITISEVVLALVNSAIVIFCIIWLVFKQYKRCGSDRVLVIYGQMGQGRIGAKMIRDGGALVWPLIQDYAYLNLEPIQMELSLPEVELRNGSRTNVIGVLTVAIDTSAELLPNAATHLIGLDLSEVRKRTEEIVTGPLRQAVRSIDIENIRQASVLESVHEALKPELAKIGLKLVSAKLAAAAAEPTNR